MKKYRTLGVVLTLLTEGIDGFCAGVTVLATAGCIFGGIFFGLAAAPFEAAPFAGLATGLALEALRRWEESDLGVLSLWEESDLGVLSLWEDRERGVFSLTEAGLDGDDSSLVVGTLGADSRSNVRRRSARLRRADDGSALFERSLPTGDIDPLRETTSVSIIGAWQVGSKYRMSAAKHAPKPLKCDNGPVHTQGYGTPCHDSIVKKTVATTISQKTTATLLKNAQSKRCYKKVTFE